MLVNNNIFSKIEIPFDGFLFQAKGCGAWIRTKISGAKVRRVAITLPRKKCQKLKGKSQNYNSKAKESNLKFKNQNF
jgi:hypothetical protein